MRMLPLPAILSLSLVITSAVPAAVQVCLPGEVRGEQRIAEGVGGFNGPLDASDNFGTSIGSLGLLDGDLAPDLVVGAPRDDDGGFDRGAVWILFMDDGGGGGDSAQALGNPDGTVDGWAKISDTSGGFTGGLQDEDWFGNSVAPLGDLDLDGIPDVAVGAPYAEGIQSDEGEVWILFLNANGTVKSHTRIAENTAGFTESLPEHARFGFDVANIGDLDGDGVTDLAVGQNFPAATMGSFYILLLNTNGTVKDHHEIDDAALGGGVLQSDSHFGVGVSALGDIDGNGVPDIAVGAPGENGFQGAVYVLRMKADGTVQVHQRISEGAGGFDGTFSTPEYFGWRMASPGDLDGSGTDDLVVGTLTTRFWVLLMDPTGFVNHTTWVDDSHGGLVGTPGFFFGAAVGAVGDLNGDTRPDLLVGDHVGGAGTEGQAWVLFLRKGLWNSLGFSLPAPPAGHAELVFESTQIAGDAVTIRLENANTFKTANLIIGITPLLAAFKGGTLVPDLDVTILGLPTGASGTAQVGGVWPANIPCDTALYYQWWIQDAGGPEGWAASDGIQTVTP